MPSPSYDVRSSLPAHLADGLLPGSPAALRVELPYRPPLDWQSLLGYYRVHQIQGVESISDLTYERVFKLDGEVRTFKLLHSGSETGKLILEITGAPPSSLPAIIQQVRWMFDLDLDPPLVEKVFRAHASYSELWNTYPGLRIGRAWNAFETAIGTILGQNVSLAMGRLLVKQLVDSYGERVIHPVTGESRFLFPLPETLAAANLEQIKTTAKRREAMRSLSALVARGQLDLGKATHPETLRKTLIAIPGLGPWSAEYIALRGVGEGDAFPHTDLLLQRAIKNQPELSVEQLRPWRSYAAVYLWKHFSRAF